MYHNNTHKTRRRLSLGCFLNRFYHFLLFPNRVLLLASTQICLSCHKIDCTRLDAFTRWYLVRWSEVRQRDRHRKLWILNAHASTSSSMFQFPSKYHQSEVCGKKTCISQKITKRPILTARSAKLFEENEGASILDLRTQGARKVSEARMGIVQVLERSWKH